jgi:hypothetical protein
MNTETNTSNKDHFKEDDDAKIKGWQIDECNRIEQLEKNLIDQGHECILIMECYPPRLSWCEQNPCKNVEKKQ